MSEARSQIENDATLLDRTGAAGISGVFDSLGLIGLDDLELRSGIGRRWAWPKDDDILWATMLLEHKYADDLIAMTVDRRKERPLLPEGRTLHILQAGGACGVMPWKLAQHPGTVVRSFEPVRINHLAASINLANTDNAFVHHGALLAETGWTGMVQDQRANSGAWMCNDTRAHSCPVFSAADLHTQWDLIWLDVEGTEFGIVSSLLRDLSGPFAPSVVALELKGQSSRYGWSDTWTISTIEGLGYHLVTWLGNDAVFVLK